MVQVVRRRIRLRTRLRRTREWWRHAFASPLPEWSAPPPSGPPPALGPGGVAADARAANPCGRQRYGPSLPEGRVELSGTGAGAVLWRVVRVPDGTAVVAGRVGDPLDSQQAAVLTELGVVTCEPDAAMSAAAAHLLAQLAMTGVIVTVPELAAAIGRERAQRSGARGQAAGTWRNIADRLAPELAGLLRAPLPARRAEPLEWEIRSVRQRRAAMRHHAAGLARPLVSAVLVTKRPHLMDQALAALAAQTYPELEIVLVRHGHDVPVPDRPGQAHPIRTVPVPAGCNLGEALAHATQAAQGTLITKVDDDDRYGPEHVWDLVLARHYSGATVVGKGAELVYLEPRDLTVWRRMASETFTDTVAGGTLLLARDELAAVGGWAPVPRSVDRALLDRVVSDGGPVYRTHPIGFIYTRHADGHTWDADLDHFVPGARRKWHGLPPYLDFGGGR